jgi:hypothetical protein
MGNGGLDSAMREAEARTIAARREEEAKARQAQRLQEERARAARAANERLRDAAAAFVERALAQDLPIERVEWEEEVEKKRFLQPVFKERETRALPVWVLQQPKASTGDRTGPGDPEIHGYYVTRDGDVLTNRFYRRTPIRVEFRGDERVYSTYEKQVTAQTDELVNLMAERLVS